MDSSLNTSAPCLGAVRKTNRILEIRRGGENKTESVAVPMHTNHGVPTS